ncbi:hypothetical protein SteCoe_19128 [Stentor coeruleus]|uniref:GOST seven transmembrane domain-containing protein n=1 Tax=Stentor coeruleus TaxID=5963 RepID=A0A1R2BV07_9CILI|nr:hypothetical protein SteCoe_19128 [Stentor coeruleus]
MIFLYVLLSLVSGKITHFSTKIQGPAAQLIHKCTLYSKNDIYGSKDSYITIQWNPSEITSYIILLTHKQYTHHYGISYCEANAPSVFSKVPMPYGNTTMIIQETGAYYIIAAVCESRQIALEIDIEFVNPYGHIPGDLFPLIPFYFTIACVYILLLVLWEIALFFYWKYSINIQKFWIPGILVLCTVENSLECRALLDFNNTGIRNFSLSFLVIIIKSFKDSFGRVLLMGAARGWGITKDISKNKGWTIYLTGIVYFIFDFIYLITFKVEESFELYLLLLASFPLIVLNTLIFFFVFSWFSKILYKLNFLKQNYKLKLVKQFALLLGLAGLASVIWGTLEILARFFWKQSDMWKWDWLYIGIWEAIFLILVISLIAIWRVSKNSKLLAITQEIRDDDNEISQEEEEAKYGIELSKVKNTQKK